MDNPWAEPYPDDWTAPSWNPSEPEPRPEVPQIVHDTSSEQQTVCLHSLLHHCHQVSRELWPEPQSGTEGDWRSGFDNLVDIAGLLAQLVPSDTTLPPTVHFSETATAKAMNEALKLTRHLPVSANSPLSHLLASKGSLDREKFINAKPDVVSDSTVHVGWRVLGKEDRLSTAEESKPKKATTGSFLSFWSRRTSAIQPAPVETPRECSPTRPSLESVKSLPHSSPSQTASPTKPSTASVSPLPSTDSYPTGVAAASAPSAVSRFLNRFSRSKGTPHSVLALSSDDLEFLSDIVPSACDPPDEDINQNTLVMLTGASNLSPLPPKLPPPIPPPLKQPVSSSRSSSVHVLGSPDGASVIASTPTSFQTQDASNIPLLAPPLSPKPVAHTKSSLSLQDVVTPTIVLGQPSTSTQQRPQSHPIPLPLSLSPVQKVLPLPFPPLLPPPPVSPQTPRPGAFSFTTSARSPTQDSSAPTYDPDGSDDEFTAFTSFPAPGSASFLSSESYPPLRSPSPPSPPPRRTYERTHYPSSSSTSSILSPASHSSADQLCSNGASVSVSLDGFDDFISSPSAARQENRKHTPSPPPLPAKTPSQEWRLPHTDTRPSRTQHSHTPSRTFASPTIHTSLMTNISPPPSVSNMEHQRTQALVNHAAARGGLLWPNSPELGESKASKIPPPMTGDSFDLLSDTLGDGLETSPTPLGEVGNLGIDSVSALFRPSNVAGGPGQHLGSREPQLSSPSLSSMSSTTIMTSFLGAAHAPTALNVGSLPPTKPKQTGRLSAQDLSFFEGL